jgi:hypothetical protein
MNHFPLFENLDASKTNSISNTTEGFKYKFSGALPYVRFISYQNGEPNTIGTDGSYNYENASKSIFSERFPPLVTGLEVKPGGSMGVLREGHVTIKFASIQSMELRLDFFRIGTPKAIIWGWTKDRYTGNNRLVPQTMDVKTAKGLVDNIPKWISYCGSEGSQDGMVGPLIDFSYTINNDASVDATFVVGTKNEIPAYLGTTSHSKDTTNSSNKDSALDNRICRLLELENSEFLKLKPELAKHVINYQYANKNFFIQFFTDIWEYVSKEHDGFSEDVFVSMEYIVDYTINKQNGKPGIDYKLDITNAVAASHPNIISNSENVLFPNKTMALPLVEGTGDGATLSLNISKTQNFSQKSGKQFPEQTDSSGLLNIRNSEQNNYGAGKWGYIKNIFLKLDFVLDAMKSVAETGKINDFVQKLCDEINVAACGLMELAPQVQSNTKEGTMIYTIVDYALIPDKVQSANQIDLFNPNTTITNISFTSDLPKEIIAMAMLSNQKSKDVGKNLFFEFQQDKADILNLKNYRNEIGLEQRRDAIRERRANRKAAADKATADAIKAAASGGYGMGFGAVTPLPGGKGTALIDDNCVIFKHLDNGSFDNNKLDVYGIIKDTALCKNLYFGGDDYKNNNPLLPIELELTVLGISGITVGKIVKINRVPFSDRGIFQVTEVTHSVGETWETKIKFRYRPNN